jgi:cytochrome c oxidase subunit I+III
MTAPRVLDVSALPVTDISNDAPLWWGQVLLAAIEGTMFGILIAAYFYLRLGVDVWPPPGTQIPHTLAPTLALLPLLASAYGSYLASQGAKEDSRRKMLTGMALNMVLATAFLLLRAYEMHTLNFDWETDAHGSIVWTILYLHTFDAIADMLYTAVLIGIIASGRYDRRHRLGVHVDSVVWYFIVGIWIPLYVVVFWGPRLVGAP